MSAIGIVLSTVLLVFQLLLVARGVADWLGVRAGGPEPAWRSGLRRVTHATTEPVLAPVRRVLRPVRIGSVCLDLALPAVLLVVILLRPLALGL